MKVRRWLPLQAGLLAAGVVLGFSSGALGAVIPLSTLVAPGALPVPSADGSVVFSGFSYTPTVNAPPANAINIITDASNPTGLWIQGPFSVVNGDELDALLGFVATLSAGMPGEFTGAEMQMLNSSAHGYIAGPPSSRSHAKITETITSLPGNSPATDLTVFDGADDGPGADQKSDSKSLAGFGRQIRVSKDIALRSVGIPGAATYADVSWFSQSFVPEPTTGLLLLSLAGAVLRRRR